MAGVLSASNAVQDRPCFTGTTAWARNLPTPFRSVLRTETQSRIRVPSLPRSILNACALNRARLKTRTVRVRVRRQGTLIGSFPRKHKGAISRLFRSYSIRFSSSSRTFNPKVAGSIPARPTELGGARISGFGRLPRGVTLHSTYPRADDSRAVCLWGSRFHRLREATCRRRRRRRQQECGAAQQGLDRSM